MIRRSVDRVSMGVEALRRVTADDGPVASMTRARLLGRVQRGGRRRLVAIAVSLAIPAIITGTLAAKIFGVGAQAVPPAPPRAAVSVTAKQTPQASVESSPDTAPPVAAVDAYRELASYGATHAAHFVRKRFAEALRLWTAYLQTYPEGRFVPEATYNRALALVHLGRRKAAIAALRPIAAGQFGDYRRQEAEALLGALAATRDSLR